MKLNKLIESTLKDFLKEEELNRFILLAYNDEYNDDLEEYGIDKYEAADEVYNIAKNGGVNILRDKNLSGVLIDTLNSKVIGGVWVSDDNEVFSFDIAIDKPYQNMGLSHMLIKDVIGEYEFQKSIHDEIGNDFRMEVDVINPKLAQILKNKYNFKVVKNIDNNRVLMSRD